MEKQLWCVGMVFDKGESEWNWALGAVCDTEAKAVSYCNNERCFVAPVMLNKPTTETLGDIKEWKGAYYPKATQ